MLISGAYSISGVRSCFSYSKTPTLGKITALKFSNSSKQVRMGENA